MFDQGARLVFTNLSAPWVAIVAKRIKFRDPLTYSTIEAEAYETRDGGKGGQGGRGADDLGETNRRGNDGKPGLPGLNEAAREVKQLPTLYIIAEKLVDHPNQEIPAGILNVAVLIRGINGGNGGQGGRGGDGGTAGNGKEGATSLFDCKEGAGPGGTGGNSGPGGRGAAVTALPSFSFHFKKGLILSVSRV